MKTLKLCYLTCLLALVTAGCNHVTDPIWTLPFKGKGLAPEIEYSDTNVVVVSYIGSLLCIDSKSGKILCKYDTESFSKIHFDYYLYFFKEIDRFVKVNPFNPKEKWELQLENGLFYTKSIFRKDNKIYLLGYKNVWKIDEDSLQIIYKHSYSKNLYLNDLNVKRIYADYENVFYTSKNKLYINSYKDTINTLLLDSLTIYNDFAVKRNGKAGYYILDYNYNGPLKIYRLESDRKLKKIHEGITNTLPPDIDFNHNDTIAYESIDTVIVYSLKTESTLLKYPFSKRIGSVKVDEDMLFIHEIINGHNHNRSRIHFVDIRDGHLIRKIKFDQLVRDFEVVDDKIYYSMDNSVRCSKL